MFGIRIPTAFLKNQKARARPDYLEDKPENSSSPTQVQKSRPEPAQSTKQIGLLAPNPNNDHTGFFNTFYQNTVPPILFKGVYKKDFHSFNKQFVFILFGLK